VGDPLDLGTAIGPLVAARQRDRVEGYIRSGQEEGAKVATGGGRPGGFERGYYVEPTVFADVNNAMRIAQEEIFGPVLVVIPYDGDDQAVALANDSDYGLCGSVWTADNDRGLGVARLQAVGRRARVRARGPRAVPRVEVDQPSGGVHAAALSHAAGVGDT
jgi:betaine-aldehyde dehydrogenase